VNIGSRQNKREQGENCINVQYSENEIELAILKSIKKGKIPTSAIYGTGDAGEKIAKLLTTLPLQFHKTITY
jgi:hypothetical protein